MAANQTRSVTIKINGKEIEHTMRNIRNETTKLRNEINNKLTPGTDAYNRKVKELQGLNQMINDHNNRLRGTGGIWGSITKEVKQFGILAAGYFGAGQIIGGVQNFIKSSADLDEQLTDVMKVTGLTTDQVKNLASELKKIDTRTSRSELLELSYMAGKLGIQGQEDILGFVRAADKINVALGKDLGADAVQEIGKLVSIFKLEDEFGIEDGMLKIASAINDIGMASTASEGYLVDFLKRMGGISGIAKISAADNIALAGTLDSLGQTAETSSTAISKTLTTMAKNTAQYAEIAGIGVEEFSKIMEEDALEALLLVLDGVGKTEGGIEALAATLGDMGADGGRVVGVLGSLASNTDEVRRQMEIANKAFEDGTSVVKEFDLKNATLGATLAKLGKAIRQELVQPEFIEYLKNAAFWISENVKEIIAAIKTVAKLGAVYLTFAGTMKMITLILATYNGLQKAGIALSTSQRIATVLLYKAKKILAMDIGRADKAMKLFNLTTKMSPVGLLVGLLAAAATAFVLFKKDVDEATDSQNKFNESVEEGQRILDNTKSLEKRVDTINKLNKNQLESLLSDIDAEIAANEKKNAELLALEKERIDKSKKLLGLDKPISKNTVPIKEGLFPKTNPVIDEMVADMEKAQNGIVQNEIEANIIKLNNYKEMVAEKIKAAEKGAKDDNTISKETLDENAKQIEAFYKFLEEMRNSSFMRSLSEMEREKHAVKEKYKYQLEVAKKFWGDNSEQAKSLTILMETEIQEIKDKFAREDQEKKEERQKEFYEKWKELNDENLLNDIKDEQERALRELALEEERELAKLENYEEFEELKLLVEERYLQKRRQIKDSFDKAYIESEKAKSQQEIQIQIATKDAVAGILGTVAGMLNQGSGAWKLLKIAEAKISMISAMQRAFEASIHPAAGPAAVVLAKIQMASAAFTGMANVISIAKTPIPTVPEQYYTGGFNVKGGQDGKLYNATFSNQKGGFVGTNNPNIVLGGEKGEEYWINNEMMRNPQIADIAYALEAYRTKSIAMPDFSNIVSTITSSRQMQTGGYTSTSTWKSRPAEFINSDNEMLLVLKEILNKLGTPVPAVFDYDYFSQETDFMDKLKDIARG